MGGARKMPMPVSGFSVRFEASPFHTVTDGFIAEIFSVTRAKLFHCACVSFITQKCEGTFAPSVVKVWTAPCATSSGKRL